MPSPSVSPVIAANVEFQVFIIIWSELTMEMNATADSIEALRRKMLIAGAAGLHESNSEAGQELSEPSSSNDGKSDSSDNAPDDRDTEKTIQS